MWRVLSSLWNRTPSRPPSAPHTTEDESDSLPFATPADSPGDERAPAPEPFPVFEGWPEGYQQSGIVRDEYVMDVSVARDPEGREVVLWQFQWPAAAGPAALMERFRSLGHPLLVRPLAGYVAADRVTLVTRRAGDDCGAWLERCRQEGHAGIPAAPLLSRLGDAAEGLDYLQARGIRHRDLQASHLVLAEGHARVDGYFMLPEMEPNLYHALPPPPRLLQFVPPEECRNTGGRGNTHPYRLAALYHYLRTGRFPFAGSSGLDVLLQIVQGTPDLSALPEAERTVVGRALAREPRERHGSCVELVRALKSAVAPGCARPARARRADSAWLAWNGGTVRTLARAIFAGDAFDRLPTLADALEDAGCADAELIEHLRGPGPHVRGCWAVNLLLGKG